MQHEKRHGGGRERVSPPTFIGWITLVNGLTKRNPYLAGYYIHNEDFYPLSECPSSFHMLLEIVNGLTKEDLNLTGEWISSVIFFF